MIYVHLIQNNTSSFKIEIHESRHSKEWQVVDPLLWGGAALAAQACSSRVWALRRLAEFALKKDSWHTQAFFLIHRLSKHILVQHFFVTRVCEELG